MVEDDFEVEMEGADTKRVVGVTKNMFFQWKKQSNRSNVHLR
jgi:hypothetical protein